MFLRDVGTVWSTYEFTSWRVLSEHMEHGLARPRAETADKKGEAAASVIPALKRYTIIFFKSCANGEK